ncbi:MAG: hypothetical protein JWQ98_1980 [Chlorobi bacterium]|nr:hypothetical protein [Chlorobiota bacterium]
MNEELHHLLDGELSDSETAEMLRKLAEDGEQRSLFRQQLMLQSALNRNEAHQPMSSPEASEMYGRLSNAIGAPAESAANRFGTKALGMLGIGLLVGCGLGFLINSTTGGGETRNPPVATIPHADTIRVMTPAPCNSDSLIAAVRDSITAAIVPAPPPAPKKRVVRSSRSPKNMVTTGADLIHTKRPKPVTP